MYQLVLAQLQTPPPPPPPLSCGAAFPSHASQQSILLILHSTSEGVASRASQFQLEKVGRLAEAFRLSEWMSALKPTLTGRAACDPGGEVGLALMRRSVVQSPVPPVSMTECAGGMRMGRGTIGYIYSGTTV